MTFIKHRHMKVADLPKIFFSIRIFIVAQTHEIRPTLILNEQLAFTAESDLKAQQTSVPFPSFTRASSSSSSLTSDLKVGGAGGSCDLRRTHTISGRLFNNEVK